MRVRVWMAGGLVAAWCGLAAVAAAPAPPSRRMPAKVARDPRPAAKPPSATPESVEYFEKEVRPLLAAECYSCHGAKVSQAGLRLDSREAMLKGGARGPSVTPGAPGRSLILQAVRHQGLQMPPGRKLPERQAAALEQWIRMGAPWPSVKAATLGTKAPTSWEQALKERKNWWSLRPVRRPVIPAVRNPQWSGHPVDRFILSALEKRGLKPGPRADRGTLARRVYLTLLGLPPTPEEIALFVDDRSPAAYERLVDRVLASPHFGERWARHWMDVVRFGETHGYEWNYEVRYAWRYRDYLIRAFNQDVPYDRLVREHIAGDLLPEPRWNREEQVNESAIGTAFYRFGEVGHDVFKEIGLDVLDNQIDTLSKGFQATTVSCARCHDHKLDAVSTKDYYALLGILASSRQVVHTLDSDEAGARSRQRLRELKSDIRNELAALWAPEAERVGRYLLAAQAVRDARPDAAELARDLDPKLLASWNKALGTGQPPLESPLHAWFAAAGPDTASAWAQAAERYRKESAERAGFNAKNFISFGDFRSGRPYGWRVDGLGLRDGAVRSGDFAVAEEGDRALAGLFPAGFYTHALSPKLNGSVQSPYLGPKTKFVSVEMVGGRESSARLIPDHRTLSDTRDLKHDTPTWVRLGRSDRDERVYLELITKFHNPRFTEKFDPAKGTILDDPRSFFGVTRAVVHDCAESPKDELARMLRLFEGPDPKTPAEAAERYGSVIRQALAAWSAGKAGDDAVSWLDWLVRQDLLSNAWGSSPKLAALVSQYREVEKELAPARVVAGTADQDAGFDVPVYVRGDFKNEGETVRRRYLEALYSPSQSVTHGSGRRELADWIANPRNPLTARVMANRVWHWLFGTGIVRTTDDFGHMGEPPSHATLLDYLASDFVAPGGTHPIRNTQHAIHTPWSLKGLIRTLVLTETFRMAGQASPRGREVDPENRLLHHFPTRRLEAEAIRDSILAVSGRLDRTLYGPSIQPFRDEPTPERRLFGGPLDGNGRRSVYTKITLMEGPRFLSVFNFPDPKTSQGRRDVTNVPAQALALMNDPFVTDQAGVWADRLTSGADATPRARLGRMFLSALGRAPKPPEAARFEKAVADLAALHEVPAGEIMKSRLVWKDVAHAIFNMKEFIYVR